MTDGVEEGKRLGRDGARNFGSGGGRSGKKKISAKEIIEIRGEI